tara:strand:+ start:294 stop:593 length:300 start_codon:yes stop_codon:yes gene_type:complete
MSYDVEYLKQWLKTVNCGICHKEVFRDERHKMFSKDIGMWESFLHGDCVAEKQVGGKPNLHALHKESYTYIARKLAELPKLEKQVADIKQLALFEGSQV